LKKQSKKLCQNKKPLPMQSSNCRIEVLQDDITKVHVDVIVNAANSSLMGGGGVDGAIHRAGGAAILEECKRIIARQGECPTGEAVITTGGNLPTKYVIHTVGPVWHGGSHQEAEKLAECYRNSLILAVQNNCKTIAFPNISTGVYRFPKEEAAHIAVHTVQEFLQKETSIEKVIFVCFDEENAQLTQEEINKI
jgi:O-acetyl-ADP-ribose deacetylase (regulator of RNase III)